MLAGLTGWHLLIILAVIILLFGAAKLPALAKSIGQSTRIFRSEMRTLQNESKQDEPLAEDSTTTASSPSRIAP